MKKKNNEKRSEQSKRNRRKRGGITFFFKNFVVFFVCLEVFPYFSLPFYCSVDFLNFYFFFIFRPFVFLSFFSLSANYGRPRGVTNGRHFLDIFFKFLPSFVFFFSFSSNHFGMFFFTEFWNDRWVVAESGAARRRACFLEQTNETR